MKKFPYIFLTIASLTTIFVGIIYKNSFLTIIASVAGLSNVAFLSLGLRFSYVLGVVSSLLYSFVAFNSALYGEVIFNLFVFIPIKIYAFLTWKQNKKTKNVDVQKLPRKEKVLMSAACFVLMIGFYFLLKNLNTRNLLLSTFSTGVNFLSLYLLARRSKYGFLTYLLIDVITGSLWLIPLIKGNLEAITIFMSVMMWFVVDIYGYINWSKMWEENKNEDKRQNKLS